MNNESSKASAQQQQQPESASNTHPIQPTPSPTGSGHPTDTVARTQDQAADDPNRPAESMEEHAAEPENGAAGGPSRSESPVRGENGEADQASSETGPQRRKIQVGSRRGRAEGTAPQNEAGSAATSQDKPDQESDVPGGVEDMKSGPGGPIPVPSARDSIPADVEQELAAALDDASLDEMLTASTGEGMGTPLELESRHQARISRINGDNVFVSLDARSEGVASLRQFPEPPELGAEVEVIVKSYSADDGLYEVAVPGAAVAVDNWSDLVEGMVVETRITGANTGGLECKVGGLRGFIPASQIALFRVEDYAEYVDQKMLCVVTEINPKRKNLVLSRRAVLEREKEEARRQLLESLEVGQVVEGVVRKIMAFGAFVDIGGIDGLVHISQLSWDRVDHPSEVLQVGQQIRVKIERIDKQTGKIGLSYRDLLDHPWHNVEEKFPVDTVVKGTVSRTAKFGAFVKLAPGVEGLIHISELSHGRVPNVGAVVSEGQEVDVKVLSVDPDAQRIALSIKAVLPEPEEESEAANEQEDAIKAQRDKQAAQRTAPLKGGVGRDSGGAQFGLKW
ncbi:MAG: 30S ribosomal protein S1 [Planctomycetota bacterium]